MFYTNREELMKSRDRMSGLLLLFLFLTMIVPVMAADSYSGQNSTDVPSLSPVNPEFTKFMSDARASRLDYNVVATSALGLVPTTVDLSFSKGAKISNFGTYSSTTSKYSPLSSSLSDASSATDRTSATLPGRFDLRTMGKVTPVKDQAQCGSCWAFSTFASLESGLLTAESWDFSENNLRNSHGYDLSSCQGGNSMMATAYLARWSGALTEASDPYSTVSKSATSVTSPNSGAVKHIQEVLYIPDRSSALDNENIKKALSEKGAVYSTIRWEDSSYRSSTASYYYSGSSTANHAITIVGWDDSYDRTRFSMQPAGNGAFIVKNSWGTSWGENGYFYVSYYDTVIGRDNAFFSAEGAGNYYHIYQYDPLGWVVSYGDNSDTAYFANVFTAQSAEDLTAVSFYTASTDSKYQLVVYRGVSNNPVSGNAEISQSGTIGVPGYHTIPLSSAVRLQKGERFSVVVKLTTPAYKFPVAIEYPLNGFSSGARATTGQSYVSSSGTLWTDITSMYPNTNVCLKAFTVQSSGSSTLSPTSTHTGTPAPTPTPTTTQSDTRSPTVTISSPRSFYSVTPGSSVKIVWSATDNTGVTGVDIGFSKDKGNTWVTAATNQVKSGSYSLSVPADASGTFMIRITARDRAGNEGSSTRSCSVTSSSQASNFLGIPVTLTPAVIPTATSTPMVTLSVDDKLPVLSISSPDSTSAVNPGTTLQVTWSATDNKGVSGVSIAISKDKGKSWNTVAGNLAKSGTYTLSIPSDVSGTLIIRITARDSSGNEASVMRNCIVRSSPLSTPVVKTTTTIAPVSIPTTISVDRPSRLTEFLSR